MDSLNHEILILHLEGTCEIAQDNLSNKRIKIVIATNHESNLSSKRSYNTISVHSLNPHLPKKTSNNVDSFYLLGVIWPTTNKLRYGHHISYEIKLEQYEQQHQASVIS